MSVPPTSAGRRLLRRVPVRVRQYWKLLVGCVAFVLLLTVVVNTVRIQPYVTSASDESGGEPTVDIAGSVDLFDASKAHSISLTFRDEDYQRMLDGYFGEGAKDYVEADLTIDGTTIPSVGIRLKGNSTLSGLTRNGESRAGGFGGETRPQLNGGEAPELPGSARPDAAAPGGGGVPGGGMPGGGFGRASLQAEEPEDLPWLIRFDEFVDGRVYQGHREIAVRVAGMGGGSTVLNEAVSLNVLAAAGEVSQRYAYTSFTVNDRPTTARLIVEHPDENFADRIGGNGVLYKSLASGQFTDQGDDPIDYQDDFDQITKKGSQDLQPVIDLIRWVQNSSDTEFAENLDEHVDVESFARYAAWQNLLLNFDDMSGPGRNYYLWYDLTTKKFSVIGWDYNLTFGGSAQQGANDTVSMGGGFRGGGGPPTDMQLPDGFQPPEGFQPPGGQTGNRTGGAFGGGNTLKERFLASPAFTEVYEDAYRTLYEQVYASGAATAALDQITRVLSTVDGYDEQAVSADVEQLRTTLQQRAAYLATDEVVTGN